MRISIFCVTREKLLYRSYFEETKRPVGIIRQRSGGTEFKRGMLAWQPSDH